MCVRIGADRERGGGRCGERDREMYIQRKEERETYHTDPRVVHVLSKLSVLSILLGGKNRSDSTVNNRRKERGRDGYTYKGRNTSRSGGEGNTGS